MREDCAFAAPLQKNRQSPKRGAVVAPGRRLEILPPQEKPPAIHPERAHEIEIALDFRGGPRAPHDAFAAPRE